LCAGPGGLSARGRRPLDHKPRQKLRLLCPQIGVESSEALILGCYQYLHVIGQEYTAMHLAAKMRIHPVNALQLDYNTETQKQEKSE